MRVGAHQGRQRELTKDASGSSPRKRAEDVSKPSTMAPLLLTVAKSKRTGFLTGVRRKIVNLKAICDDPEALELDKLSTASERLAEAWQKYESRQQNVLGLIAEDKVGD